MLIVKIDKIIPRHKLRDEIYNLLSILLKLKEKEEEKYMGVTRILNQKGLLNLLLKH